jgi:alpha-D-ribose 1-methylphosphonate 5-triphosphate synthase subunit PhnG
MNAQTPFGSDIERKTWMGLLARADATMLASLFETLPAHNVLRAPEIGAVMVRGRMGGTGQPFNLGEMTITRCSVQLDQGEAAFGAVGHAYVQGRNAAHATRAAILDALLQTDDALMIYAQVVQPLADLEAQQRRTQAAKAAATRVEFFTLQRGEDA